jgi:CelD/BcsL family acetyltransferase involved in cellulose biosynthesis
MNPIRVRIIDTLAGFEQLADTWQDLAKTVQAPPTLSHPWLLTWLQHFPVSRLAVLVAEDAHGQLLAAAPLKIDRIPTGTTQRLLRQLSWIGTDPSVVETMDALFMPGVDPAAIVAQWATLIRALPWDVLDLRFMKHPDIWAPVLSGLTQATQQMDMPMAVKVIGADYHGDKQGTWLRKTIRNSKKRLRDEGGDPQTELVMLTGDEAAEAMTGFAESHRAYWQQRGVYSDFARFPQLLGFYQALCQSGQMFVSQWRVGGQVASTHVAYWETPTTYLCHLCQFDEAFARFRPGFLHFDAVAHYLAERGGGAINFGRGDEDYKGIWTSKAESLQRFRAFANPLIAALYAVNDPLTHAVKGPIQRLRQLAAR